METAYGILDENMHPIAIFTPSRVEAAASSIGSQKVIRGEGTVLQAVDEDPYKEVDEDCIGKGRQASQRVLLQHADHCGRCCIQDAACTTRHSEGNRL